MGYLCLNELVLVGLILWGFKKLLRANRETNRLRQEIARMQVEARQAEELRASEIGRLFRESGRILETFRSSPLQKALVSPKVSVSPLREVGPTFWERLTDDGDR